MNMTDRSHIVKIGSVVGKATPACAFKNSEASMRQVSPEGQIDCENVSLLIRDLKETAPAEVRQEAVKLVTTFEDIFAVNDLDLGIL